jgi:hypothetical protein
MQALAGYSGNWPGRTSARKDSVMQDDVTVTVSFPKGSLAYQRLVEDARDNGVSVADMLARRASDWYLMDKEARDKARNAQAKLNADAALDYWE